MRVGATRPIRLWRHPQLQKKIDALHAERAEARKALTVVHPEQEPLAGAVVSIDHKGKLEIVRGLLRADDARRFARLEKARAAQASPRCTQNQ